MRIHLRPLVSGGLAAVFAASLSAQAPAQAALPDDPVATLAGRLDLDKYKATIKGLTQLGDRRQGTKRNRVTVDWALAAIAQLTGVTVKK